MAITGTQISLLGLIVSGDVAGLTIYTTRTGRKVWYEAAPPTKPLTVWQLAWQRNLRIGMRLWSNLTPAQRAAYRQVCDRARLCMLGHNLWLRAFLGGHNDELATLEHQYQCTLVKPPLL